MTTGRLEAFSDGVLAIIITIMVLELDVPHGHDLESLRPVLPTFITYVLSFIYLGVYWNNHHHLMQTATSVNGTVLWANLHLLFWLSLLPFATGFMGENHFLAIPTALYGAVLFMSAIAWHLLILAMRRHEDDHQLIHRVYKPSWKNYVSLALYATAIGLSFITPYLACVIFILVAAMWFVPERRAEHAINTDQS